jgi:hypothetical protein
MGAKPKTPLISEEGEARTPTVDEWRWAVRAKDFEGFDGSHNFLMARDAFLKKADALGIDREVFLAFAPNKPGFIERATEAFDTLVKQTRHAAE